MKNIRLRILTLTVALICAFAFLGCAPIAESGGNTPPSGETEDNTPPDVETESKLTDYIQQTEIPTLKITAATLPTDKFNYVDASFKMESDSGDYDFQQDGELRLRGNYTQTLDKKPYRVKFSKKVAPIGMDSAKTWELIADATDFSFLRNYLGYTFADKILDYALRARYVRVEVNGEYRGLYIMTDKKGEDADRIPLDITANADTGFLIELDNRAIGGDNPQNKEPYAYCLLEDIVFGENAFYIQVGHNLEVCVIKEPEPVTPEQFAAIKQYVMQAADALSGSSYQTYFDADAMARYYIVQELWHNTDVGSVYFYRKNGTGKLKMGPVWDLDLSCGISKILPDGKHNGYDEWYYREISNFYSPIYASAEFKASLKKNYNVLYGSEIADMLSSVDDVAAMIADAAAENFEKWDTVGKGVMIGGKLDKTHFISDEYYALTTHAQHVNAVKTYLTQRAEWMYNRINA